MFVSQCVVSSIIFLRYFWGVKEAVESETAYFSLKNWHAASPSLEFFPYMLIEIQHEK